MKKLESAAQGSGIGAAGGAAIVRMAHGGETAANARKVNVTSTPANEVARLNPKTGRPARSSSRTTTRTTTTDSSSDSKHLQRDHCGTGQWPKL
jgi:hypothetical protein